MAGLNLQLLSQFNDKLDDTYKKLQELDIELQKFEKLAPLNINVGPGMRAAARALDELARAMQRFSAASPQRITAAAENVFKFVESFALAGAAADAKNIRGLAKFLQQATASVQEVAKLQASFGTISDVQQTKAADFITKTIQPLVSTVETLLKTGKDLTPERLKALSDSFRAVGDLFVVLGGVTTSVGRVTSGSGPGLFKKNPFDALKQVLNFVVSLFTLAKDLTPERIKNLTAGFGNLSLLFLSLGKSVEVLVGLQSQFTRLGSLNRSISLFQRSIAPFLTIARDLAQLAQTTDSKVFADVALLFKALGEAVDVMDGLRTKFNKLGSLSRSLGLFKRIGETLADVTKSFAKASQGGNTQIFTAISPLLDGLGRTFKTLEKLQSSFKDFSFVNRLFKSGDLFRSLKIFKTVGSALKDIVKSFTGIKDDGSVLTNITKFVPRLLALVKALQILDGPAAKRIQKNIPVFVQVGKSLGSVFKNFGSNAKGVSADSIKGIAAFLHSITELGRTEGKFDKDLPKFIKELGKSLSGFKFDKNTIKSFESISKILSKLSLPTTGATGIKALKDVFSSEIPESIRKTEKQTRSLKDTIQDSITDSLIEIKLLDATYNFLFASIKRGARLIFDIAFFPHTLLPYIQALGNAIRGIGSQLQNTGSQLRSFGTQLNSTFGIVGLFNSRDVQTAIGFDKLSTQVQVFGNLSDEATQQAEDLAFVIGQKYPLSANDALAATLSLIKAGQDLGDIEFTLPAAADLAALSDTGDLNNVINTLIAAEGSFDEFRDGVEGTFENIAIATDIIASGANVSTASVESLGEGLANVGTAANSFGLSMEETVAVLAIFNDAGLKAAEGGTALRSLLNALDRPETTAALDRLGVALFDPETGTRRPLNDIINDISASLEDMPEAQRVAVLQQLTDTFGRQGLNILLGEGADGINNVVAEMNALPTAAEQAAALLNNLAGDIEQLKGSFETFMLRAALPMIDRFFRPVVQLLRLIVDGFLTLDDSFYNFIGTATALLSVGATLVAGFAVFAGVVLQVGGAVLTVVGTLLNFQLILGAIVAGMTGFIIGIVTIAAALTVFVPLILLVTSGFETLFQVFSTNAGGATSAAQAFFGTILSTAKTFVDFISSIFSVLSAFIAQADTTEETLETVGETIARFFASLGSVFTGGFIGDLRNVFGQLTQIFNAFAGIVTAQEEIRALTGSFLSLGNATQTLDDIIAQGNVEQRLEELKTGITNAVIGLVQNVPLFRDAIQNMFGDTSDASIEAFVDRLFGAFERIGEAFNIVKSSIGLFINSISTLGLGGAFDVLVDNLDSSLGTIVSSVLGIIKDLFVMDFQTSEIFDALIHAAEQGIGAFASQLLDIIVGSIRKAIVDNSVALKDGFLSIVDLFFAGLRNLRFISDLLGAGPIADLFDSFLDVLRGLLGGVFDTLINLIAGHDLGTALYLAFGDAILPLFDFVDAVQEIGTTLGTLFSNFINFLFPPGEPTLSEAAEESFDFLGFIADVSGFLTSLNELFLNPLSVGDFGTVIQNISNFMGSFLNTVRESISTFITGSPDSDYAQIGQAIVDKVATSINSAFLNITSALSIDPTEFIATLQTSFSPLTEALSSIFSGTEEDPSIFADIATIIERVSTALSGLFATAEETPPSNPLQFLMDFAGNLAALGLDVLTQIIETVNTIFDALANANSQDITALALALGLVFAPFLGTALGAGILAVGSALTAFFTSTAVGFFAVGLIVKAFVDNLAEFGEAIDALVEGDMIGFFTDLADAIGKTFIDLGLPVVNSLLDFFGIDVDYTNEQIRQMAVNLANIVVLAFEAAGYHLARLAAKVNADASIAARRTQDALSFGDDAELGTANQFFEVDKDFSLGALRQLEADMSAQGFTLRNSITADFAVTNQDQVAAGITASIEAAIADGNPIPLNAEDIITFQNLEVLPRLLQDAVFSGNFDVANAILSAASTAPLDAATVQTLVDSITSAVQLGLITEAEAQTLLLPLRVEPGEITGSDITPEEQNAMVDAALDTLTPGEPIPVEVPVEVVPVVEGTGGFGTGGEGTPPPAADGTTPVLTTETPLSSSHGRMPVTETPPPGAPVAETAPLAEELDLAGEDSASVQQLSTDLQTLQTYAAAVKIDLEALLPVLVQLGVDLGTSQVAFDGINESMILFSTNTVNLNLGLTSMQLTLSLIILSLTNLGLGFMLAGLLGTLAFLSLGTALTTFEGMLVNLLNTLIQGFILVEEAANRLAELLSNIVGRAQDVAATVDEAQADAEGGGEGDAPPAEGAPHAQGGSFDASQKRRGLGKYRINEGGSEVLFENGKMYLLSSGRGKISTLNKGLEALPKNSTNTGIYPATSRGQGGGSNTMNNVNVEGNQVTIHVDGSSGDPTLIANAVSESVNKELNQQSDIVRRELRRTHR